ncbi:hypothetical protein LOAG_01527 [Loa loa]|uniref:Uncharacterized protein n=1 Tax=Loa loa TaxID=7209 RepID=A0A1S0U8Z9_LOALO|nr:hypothetical protein LOAG_01527 [Loa loa]EFO26953.1 hypothetical protein LOAG_01527 [Loa loa]
MCICNSTIHYLEKNGGVESSVGKQLYDDEIYEANERLLACLGKTKTTGTLRFISRDVTDEQTFCRHSFTISNAICEDFKYVLYSIINSAERAVQLKVTSIQNSPFVNFYPPVCGHVYMW